MFRPADNLAPLRLSLIVATLLTVSMLLLSAGFGTARRALKIQPTEALRAE
jgi:ABC-type lipoprotein release transport system permease subunit